MSGSGETPPPRRGDETLTHAGLEGPPFEPERRLGPYRLIRELGRGGMGQVYLAVRADTEYHKRVAIKVIRAGLGGDNVIQRFRLERQILAGMEHPGIARLLDGGATEDGSPYFALEYVEGQAIDTYADENRLSTTARLRLFRSVCTAVEYAHRNLVVHRDIKPGNILVTADGSPKLLDFGLAKLLNAEMSGLAGSTVGGLALTPAYASPEQARGEPVTTATDVYSLGIVLYELLTGHRPYRLRSREPLEILRAVREEEPERPSTAVDRAEPAVGPDGVEKAAVTAESVSRTREGTPDRLRRRLRGDLDAIVMTALRKEATKRYSSVEALSEDVRRHLEGLPVKARKGGLTYRAGRFVTRNRIGVGSAVLLALLLVAFAVTSALQASRLARERDQVALERDKADQVSSFLVDLFKVSDPNEAKANSVTAREILDRGATKVASSLQDQPGVRAAMMETIGNVYRNLGLYRQALPLVEESLAIRRRLGEDDPEVAQAINSLANLLVSTGDLDRAEALYREALEARRRIFSDSHDSVMSIQYNLADLLNRKGDHAGAVTLLQETLTRFRRRGKPDDDAVASVLNSLSGAQREKGDFRGAEATAREALVLRRKLLGDDHPRTTASLGNLANVLNAKGDYREAESLQRKALAVQRARLGPDHPGVAIVLNNLANVLDHEGGYVEAEALHREALAIRRAKLGPESPLVARSLGNLANILRHQSRVSESERLYRDALVMTRKLLGEKNPDVPYLMTNLAGVLWEGTQKGKAEQLLREALVLQRASPSDDIAETLGGLSLLLAGTGRGAEAEPLAREAVAIRARELPMGHPEIAEMESILGLCLSKRGRFEEAEQLTTAAYAQVSAKRGDQSWEARRIGQHCAQVYEAWGKPEKAAQWSARARPASPEGRAER